jgi:hypothetical protein
MAKRLNDGFTLCTVQMALALMRPKYQSDEQFMPQLLNYILVYL